MSIELPEPLPERSLPFAVLSELNIILDESQPLPRRVALLIKWLAFFNAKTNGRVDVPSPDELTPREVRRHALRLAALVAEEFFRKRPGVYGIP